MSQDYDELCGIEPCNREWIDSLRKNLAAVIPVGKIILFGSRARRDHTTWSDYDICVVSDGFEGKRPLDRIEMVLAAWEGHRDLEPACFTTAEFCNLGMMWKAALSEGILLFSASGKDNDTWRTDSAETKQ